MNDDEPPNGHGPQRPAGEPVRDEPQRPWPKRPSMNPAGWPGARRPASREGPPPDGGEPRHRRESHEPDNRRDSYESEDRHPPRDDEAFPHRATATARVPVSPRRQAGTSSSELPGPLPVATGRARVRQLWTRENNLYRGPVDAPAEAEEVEGLTPETPEARLARAKKARRRNIVVASFAVFVMLIGIGVVGGAYYIDGIKNPDQLTFPESTTLYYSDGKTVLAKLGQVTRYNLTFDQMNDAVKEAIVASEDKTFWTNSGVDLGSVLRAAWNNITGGETQGGSTITQQYARLAFDLQGATYSRKVREAILAWKLDERLSKEKILEYYLNTVPFGRNTYGVEAASQAFFHKTANKKAPVASQITKADAMVLVSMVKQPEPVPGDVNHPGYDPTRGPIALKLARDRFEYVRQQMKDLGYLTPAEDAKLQFPLADVKAVDPVSNAGYGMDKPVGLVVNHVLSELSHSDSQFKDMPWQNIRDGGYKIYTTLDVRAENSAVAAADAAVKGSYMDGQPKQLQSALVAIQPGTGRIIAYYGGDDGKGSDYAGIYFDEKGDGNGFGRQPAGSSFKVYTLAAALNSGISLNSYWESKPHDLPGRTGSNRVYNSGTCPTGADKPCSLLNSTIASLNVPFYEVTMSVSPAKVLEMARNAGVDYMWNDARQRQQLAGADISTLVQSQFDTVLGIGQYPITVMDHANGVATFAAGGLRATAHFVTKVIDGDRPVYWEKLPVTEQRILSPEAENDLTYALSKVSASNLSNGWDTAGKTGTWELGTNRNENADAWMVGFTRRLAAAVWVGNRGAEKALRDKYGQPIYGAGIPASIWRAFMTNATRNMKLDQSGTSFAPPSFAGSTTPPGSVPPPGPGDQQGGGKCKFIIFCPPPVRTG
jgi:membrane peptidoglycan carboxypeptidase